MDEEKKDVTKKDEFSEEEAENIEEKVEEKVFHKGKALSYEERAEATFQNIGLRVFLVMLVLNLPLFLFAAPELSQPNITNGYNYYNAITLRSIILGVYGLIINIGLSKAIILHSRGIEELDGVGAVFRDMSGSILNIIAISVVISLVSALIAFLVIFPLSFVGFAAMANPKTSIGIITIFLIVLTPLLVVVSSYIKMLANTSSLLLIFDNDPIFKTISNARKEIKDKKAFSGYFKIELMFAVLTILIILGIVAVTMLNPILFLLMVPVMFLLFVICIIKYTIKLSVYLGDNVLSDQLNHKYPEIDQSNIY